MASTNKTANYQLNSCVGTDPVLREDFNADNQRLDEELTRQNRAVVRLQEGVRNQQYNLYGLLLNNYYEGRYTGMKRAMIVQTMDSYLDVQSVEDCALDVGQNCARVGDLTGTGLSSMDSDYDYVEDSPRALDEPVWQQFEMDGSWSLTGFQFKVRYLSLTSNTVTQEFEVYAADRNGAPTGPALAAKSKSYSVDSASASDTRTVTFDEAVTLTPGMYVLKSWFSASSQTALPYFGRGAVSAYSRACMADGTALDYVYEFAMTGSGVSVSCDSGVLVMQPAEMLCEFDSICGFFRHDGHVPGVEVSLDGGSVWLTMEAGETVAITGPDGRSGYETAYLLENVTPGQEGTVQLRILLDRGEDEEARLYDYGVMFL